MNKVVINKGENIGREEEKRGMKRGEGKKKVFKKEGIEE